MMSKFAADSAPLLALAFCFIGGILLTPFVPASLPLWPVLAGTLLFTFLLRRHPTAQSVAVGCCFLMLAVLLTSRQRRQLTVAWPATEVVAEAVVVSEVVGKPQTMAMDLRLVPGRQLLKGYVAKDSVSRQLTVGDRICFRARIRENSHFRSGTFDYRRYLEVHGFTGSVYLPVGRWERCAPSAAGLSVPQRVRLWFLKQRHQLLQRYRAAGVGQQQLAIVSAMALGNKSALTPEQKQLYSQTGASHVLALSGLHLSIVYTLLTLLVAGRRARLVTQLLTLLSVWAYVLLVGLPVSVVRAAVMITVYGLLALFHRDKMSVNALAFAALLLLGANPYALYDVGFQLSFLAVFSILLWLPLFRVPDGLRQSFWQRPLAWLWGLVAVSVVTQLGVAPLVAWYFGRFPTYFLLANFVAIPAVVIILYLSLATLLFPCLGVWLSSVVDALHTALTAIVRLPHSSIEGLHPSPLQIVLTYVVLLSLYAVVRLLISTRRPCSFPK